MGADYATRREPSRLREPIAHHVNIREAAPEVLSTLSLMLLCLEGYAKLSLKK
jgi:hypothetical protein